MGQQSWFASCGHSQDLSLFPIQNSGQSRPARFHKHRKHPQQFREIIKQCFVKLATPIQSLLELLVVGQEKWREQNQRHLAHNMLSHHAPGVSTHQDSTLKGNSALRGHVPREAGIELAHNEGQYMILFFFWDMQKFCDSVAGGNGSPT